MLFGLRRIFQVVAFVLFITALPNCAALEPTTPLTRLARQSWSVENGLPQNTISVLMQSRSGYMWIGTELGLARFDGNTFEVLDHSRNGSFPDSEIRCLLDDQRHDHGESLWVGTADGLVLLTEGKTRLFTTADGLPSNSIRALVQTADGQIWASTETGLAHLAGERFVQSHDSASALGPLTSLAAKPKGGLWVASSKGAIALNQGHWQADSEIGDSSSVPALVTALPGGDLLIATGEGLFREQNARVAQLLGRGALPPGEVRFMARLKDGTLALASQSSLTLAFGNPTDQPATGGSRFTSVRSESSEVRFSVGKELPGSRIQAVYADAEGSLWIGTNRGLVRVQRMGSSFVIERLPPADPLALDAVASILEDREGDLWVGTETAGLHILRDARFHMIGTSEGLSSEATTAIVQAADNTVWIGTRESGLNHRQSTSNVSAAASAQQIRTITTADGLLSNVILSLAASPDDSVWVGSPDGLNHILKDGRIESFTSSDGLPDDFVRSLLVDPDSSVWIGTRRGLTHMTNHNFKTLTTKDGLGSDLVGALARSASGDLWAATLNGLTRLHNGRLQNYTTADRLSSNIITSLDPFGGGRMWIGTQDNGLNLWDGNQIKPLLSSTKQNDATQPSNDLKTMHSLSDYLPKVLHAILHDDRGHLWLASNVGLTRADVTSLLECAEKTLCELSTSHLVSFGTADGLRSRDTSSNSHPTASRFRNGELWFTTPRGAAQVDPDHFAPLPPTPPVTIERFSADDLAVNQTAPGRQIQISPGHLRFQFEYAGLSFAAPQKLRYQYMLQGFDKSWTDAGTRRTAYYTNIPPGQYHFLVRTSFGDATFSESVPAASYGSGRLSNTPSYGLSQTTLDFELLPHFYQTVWFRLVMLIFLSAAILLGFRLRVLRVEREFGAVSAERNRIAREIHDTLAQGYVGISLQLEVLGQLLQHNRTDAANNLLKTTQELVREGLADARQSIWALRSQDTHEQTLPTRLRRLVEKAGDEHLLSSLQIHGVYRALPFEKEKEILRIAQEAIQNTRRHANANQLRVRLDYEQRELLLSIEDDGNGFEIASADGWRKVAHWQTKEQKLRVAAGAGSKHFGLTGMQERASLIRAQIEILSEAGRGTTIRVKIPAQATASRDLAETGPPEASGQYPKSSNEDTPQSNSVSQSKEQL